MVEHLLRVRCVVGSIPHVTLIEQFLVPPSAPRLVYHRLSCVMVHIKEPLLNEKSRPCSGGNGFPLSRPEWLI